MPNKVWNGYSHIVYMRIIFYPHIVYLIPLYPLSVRPSGKITFGPERPLPSAGSRKKPPVRGLNFLVNDISYKFITFKKPSRKKTSTKEMLQAVESSDSLCLSTSPLFPLPGISSLLSTMATLYSYSYFRFCSYPCSCSEDSGPWDRPSSCGDSFMTGLIGCRTDTRTATARICPRKATN